MAWGLWILWFALLIGGFIFGRLDSSGSTRIPTWCRIGSSLVLVAAGWSWATVAARTPVNGFAILIAIGMTLGFIGDLSNAELLGISNPVLGGIIAFGLGHIAYIIGTLSLRAPCDLLDTRSMRWSIVAWQVIGLVGWAIVVFRPEEMGVLRWAALPYSLLLAGTAGCMTGLAVQNPRSFGTLALGGGLFLLSDLILAWRLFRGPFLHGGDCVWLTYGPGQMFIVYAVPFAIALVSHKQRI